MRKRDKVLLAVANWKRAPADWRDRSGPTHHDIAVACGRTYSTADWAHAAIRQLLEAGHITVVAKTQFGREYAVTEAGRAALAEKST